MKLLLALLLTGCVIAKRDLAMPDNRETTVALLTGGLLPPMNDIARHPWFAVRRAGETEWKVYEVPDLGHESDPFRSHHPYVDPMLHKVWRGAEAERAATCLEREAEPWMRRNKYRFYPGPNSNTFGAAMLRACKLGASLPATAIGKDWRGLIGAGRTTERTGVELHTAIAGIRIGLKEGLSIHVLGLEFGIDLWPPAIIVPLGPGRIGFADR
ncbi:MAG TPA: DUF3750 domain-containing protein [Kofleriaceae bacterium]|nr:DUF3750 domain-containing protein [Kofleriaceae bacterium]